MSLSVLECCCGVQNRLSPSCLFQPPGIFSAYLRQICETKEGNAVPISNILQHRASAAAQQGLLHVHAQLAQGVAGPWSVTASQNWSILPGSALCLCSTIPAGPEPGAAPGAAPGGPSGAIPVSPLSKALAQEPCFQSGSFSVGPSAPTGPVPQYPVNLQVMSGSSPQTQTFPVPFAARNCSPQCL